MLLVLSHSTDETANYLCRRLDEIALEYARIDTDTCASSVQISYDQRPRLSLQKDARSSVPTKFETFGFGARGPLRSLTVVTTRNKRMSPTSGAKRSKDSSRTCRPLCG